MSRWRVIGLYFTLDCGREGEQYIYEGVMDRE